MNDFLKSFTPLLKRLKLKKYLIEVILLIIAGVITITALNIYAQNNKESSNQEIISNIQSEQVSSGKIFVDVSGAVKKSNVYEVSFGARIKEVIDMAGGLSDDADVSFFSRNFNLARIVIDQEKIYVPSITDINNGTFVQNQRTLDYASPAEVLAKEGQQQLKANPLIDLNSGTIEELDQLPGIGQITANKIINGRPYTSLEELLTKKIINKGVFEKIKDLISL